ncbi:MAG: hypothetical protein M1503_01575 [Thaumarchaeota archaeon]|nr:hypothetical protein [Nitrososphaerota archaeon]MCL5316946.1 hypothetical protein [Nitrososphaerota archaeon]
MKESIDRASAQGTPLIFIIDTSGGSLDATLDITTAIDQSSVPVVGFVYPAGSRAWSGGTYILLSTHVAAMAPHTVLGSAQPVSVQPGGVATPINDLKVLNALSSFLVERARMHERNETAASLFVTTNLNLSADEAHRNNVVEIVAPSIQDLLIALNGKTVKTSQGEYVFRTEDTSAEVWSPSLRLMSLQILSDPLLVLLLIVVVVAIAAGLFSIFAAYKAVKTRRIKPFITGMIGDTAESIDGLSTNAEGYVLYQSEWWKARTDVSIPPKSKVKIIKKEGPLLHVEPIEETGKENEQREE